MRLPNFQKEKNIKNNKLTQEEEKEVYKQNIQSRSTLHYILGLVVRWKQNLKYEKARRIARKKGAIIGEGVIIPITLAKSANKNLVIGNHVSIQTAK